MTSTANLFPGAGFEAKRIEVAGFDTARDPKVVLASSWLGGGLGVSAFDPRTGIGGLLHVLLPDSKSDPQQARIRPALFVDTGITTFLDALVRQGAAESDLVLCLVGAARVSRRNAPPAPGDGMIPAGLRMLAGRRLRAEVQQQAGYAADCCCSLEIATGEVRIKFSGQSAVTVLWKNSTAT